VWITGASSGIGEGTQCTPFCLTLTFNYVMNVDLVLGIAKELAKCSQAKIVLSARRKEELERVRRECLGA